MKSPPPPEDNGPGRDKPTEAIEEPMKTPKNTTDRGRGKPFIPAWLDEAGLTPAEMRVFIHLCRSADNSSGVAWPSYRRMVEITGLSKNTIRRAIEVLEKPHNLVAKIGKPFAGSCRYRVLPIVPPEGQMEVSNSPTTGTIEGTPIVPPETRNSPTRGTPIVPPEGQEGSPKKEIHRRESNSRKKPKVAFDPSLEAMQFATWFRSSIPQTVRLSPNWQSTFAKVFDDLVRIDGRKPEDIRAICRWARADSFWQSNFMTPAKLRKKNPDGITYFDVLNAKMQQAANTTPKPPVNLGFRKPSATPNS